MAYSSTHPNPNFRRLDSLAPSPQIADQGISYPNPNVQKNPYIYLAVYSSVPVYEMMCRGIGVMRRRTDSFMNATQILKVAGVDKGKRTKILEKDIAMGVHEKVQGGYGRYQGTWIPFERAVDLANSHGVSHLLAPLFDYTAPPPPSTLGQAGLSASAPRNGKDTDAASILSQAREQGHLPEASGSNGVDSSGRKRPRDSGGQEEYKRPKLEGGMGAYENSPGLDDWKLKKSTNPLRPSANHSLVDDPLCAERHKTILKSIFGIEPESTFSAIPDLSTLFPPDIEPDTPIDDNDHTALHWAAALARISIVRALVNFGADKYRGNNVGETPLIRAVLVTNNSDQDTFPRLLEVLGSSLRTVDLMGRTVLHHAALVAGVKGRASSARYYMESVLEYVARHEKGQFKDLVDAQDSHGDTALNIAARVGNKGLVRMLIEVGADKVKPNKLGLRPGDFGVDGVDLAVSAAEEAISSLRAPTLSAPAEKSHEVIASLTNMITSLSADFTLEVKDRADALARTRAELGTATRELADQRKQISQWRAKVAQVDDKMQRIKNLERALAEEESFDWTGRTEIDGTPSTPSAGLSFTYRGPGSTLSNLPPGISIEFDADPPLPTNDSDRNSLVHLVRLQTWYDRVVDLLGQRVERLQGGNAEHEARLQRIVAGCCGVEPDRVEGMLQSLLAALESDGSGLDMARVAGFLSRVKDGSLV